AGIFVFTMALYAVAQAQTATFDAISIKPTPVGSDARGITVQPSGRFIARSATVRALLPLAFRAVQDVQIVGGPAWLASDKFDIEATAGGPLTNEQATAAIRALLEDRFHLKTHREMQDVLVYILSVDKGGAKVKPVSTPPSPAASQNSG